MTVLRSGMQYMVNAASETDATDAIGAVNAMRSSESAAAAAVASAARTGGIGISAVLASAQAHVKSGGSLAQAFAIGTLDAELQGDVAPQQSAVPDLLALQAVFSRCRGVKDTASQLRQAVTGTHIACQLSARLGCQASRCLATVAAAHQRAQLLENLKRNVFAVPKATMALLSALPVVTLLLGSLIGAHPLEFLIGTTQGRVCFALGMCAYMAGMAWIRALMKQTQERSLS